MLFSNILPVTHERMGMGEQEDRQADMGVLYRGSSGLGQNVVLGMWVVVHAPLSVMV